MGVSRRRAGRVGRASVSKTAGKDDARWDRNARVVQSSQDLSTSLERDVNGQFAVVHGDGLRSGRRGLEVAFGEGLEMAGGAIRVKKARRLAPLSDQTEGTVQGETLHVVEKMPTSGIPIEGVYNVTEWNQRLEAIRNALATITKKYNDLIAAQQQAGQMEK